MKDLFLLMLQGMGAIFIVTVVIMGLVYLLNFITKRKKQ